MSPVVCSDSSPLRGSHRFLCGWQGWGRNPNPAIHTKNGLRNAGGVEDSEGEHLF